MSLLAELKRRNVFRAAAAYVAAAWLVMQVAEVTFPAFGFTDRALRLLIIALAIGFLPATALAWVFELTPQGFKRERDLDRSGPLVAHSNRLLDRAIVVLLALGMTYFAVDKFFLNPARERARVQEALEQGRSEALEERLGDKSIVVLPSKNLSADPAQEFFADGMAEDMLNLLARIPELRVISRTSAFAFKGKDVGIPEIAEKLKVTHVLESSVRQSGDQLRVTVQLIEVETESALWSEIYDRTLADVFDVQDDIAARVVDALRLKLLDAVPKSRRVDTEAYMLFLQAREMLDDGGAGRDDLQATVDLLKRALAIDPNYADAWTGLAHAYYSCLNRRRTTTDPVCRRQSVEETLRLSNEAEQAALSIDPDNAIAIAYSAWGLALEQSDWAGAAPGFERALRLDPADRDVLRPALAYAAFIMRPQVAVRLAEYSVARDPMCRHCIYVLAKAYRDAERFADAEDTMRRFAVATGLGGWNSIALAQLAQGDVQGALATVEKFDQDDFGRLQVRAMALHSLGREDESFAELGRLEELYPDEYEGQAVVHAWRGEVDKSLNCLERDAARVEGSHRAAFDWPNPFLRSVLQTARGQALLRRFGAADEQLEGIQFDPHLPGER